MQGSVLAAGFGLALVLIWFLAKAVVGHWAAQRIIAALRRRVVKPGTTKKRDLR